MSQRRYRIVKAGGKGPGPALASSSLIALALLSLLPLGIQASADGATDQPLLAVVGEIRITTDDLLREMQRRPGGFSTAERRQALLDALVTDALAYEAAVKEGFDRHPDVARAVRGLIARRYTRKSLEKTLAGLLVTDEEVEAFYKENQSRFTRPARLRGAMIRLSVPAQATGEKRSQVRRRADEARSAALQLRADTAGFGKVAVSYSDHRSTRYRGGGMGWITRSKDARWEPAVIDALHGLAEPGAVSDVVETPGAFYIVKLVETEASEPLALAIVSGRIHDHLLREKRQALTSAYSDSLKDRISTERFPAALEAMDTAQPEPVAPAPPPVPGPAQ